MDLSIIITHYNYNDHLPVLLDNIVQQNIAASEVIIVDDCSEHSCADIIRDFSDRLSITFVQNEKRCFTKETRLRGIEHASGKLITFIDADDLFFGKHALRYHLDLAMQTDADIVHFCTSTLQNGVSMPKGTMQHTFPLADKLTGDEVFAAYVNSELMGHLVWGKLFKKDLWLKCLAPARAFDVRRYREDMFLSTLLFFHACSYIGSQRIGYQREFKDTAAIKAFGRMATEFVMLSDLVPYLAAKGAPRDLCDKIRKRLQDTMVQDLVDLLKNEAKKHPDGICTPDSITPFLEHADMEKIPRILLSSLVHLFRQQAEEAYRQEAAQQAAYRAAYEAAQKAVATSKP